jgi:hypothetical protein
MTAMRASLAVLLIGALLASCGGGGDDELTADAEQRLAPLVQQVRDRAGSFDPDGARVALAELRGAVAELRGDDQLGDDRAAAILATAADVEHRLSLAPTTTTTTTTTTTAPPPPPAPVVAPEDDASGDGPGPGKGSGHAKGNEHGKGKAKEKG